MIEAVIPSNFPAGAAFVLGGSGLIGGAICRAFGRRGVPVALTYNHNRDAAEQMKTDGFIAGVAIYQLDAGNANEIENTLAQAAEKFGGIHSVVYAGGPRFSPQYFSEMDDEVWEEWFHNDAMACIKLARLAIPYLHQSSGSFTAISTYQGVRVEKQGAASAVSKAAIDRMIAVIAKEEGRKGVRANAVQCGWISGDRTQSLMENLDLLEAKQKQIPLGRLGYPDEIGETVCFLSSQAAGFITGQTLTADGGETL